MPAIAEKAKPRYQGMRVTREIYLDLEDDGYKYDMIDGVLQMSPSANFYHNRLISKLLMLIENHLAEKQINAMPAPETDLLLPDGEDTLRPDICIILKKNYEIIQTHIHGVPDVIVEVLSDTTRKRDLGEKADRYLQNGVSEYWIADPDEKRLAIWINKNKTGWEKKEGESIASSVLEGFTIQAKDIFG